MMTTLPSRILQDEKTKLEDLTRKSLASQIFDYEEYKKKIRQFFQRINEATMSFQVRTFIDGYAFAHWLFPDRNIDQHPIHGGSDARRHQHNQGNILGLLACDVY